MELSGRTILITGGASGIGLGLAATFRQSRNRVIICGRSQDKLAQVKEKYPDITTLTCDISDVEQRKQLVSEILRRFLDFDILVNNAGIQRYIDLRKGYDELKSGEDEIATNLVAPIELTALFIDHLIKRPSAAIINISSGLGFMPAFNTPVYNATKAAIHAYSLVLRQQLKDTPVRVVEVVPPMVDTGLNKIGRDAVQVKNRGITVADYVPTIIQGLKDDAEIIFYGENTGLLAEPRAVSENRLLKASW